MTSRPSWLERGADRFYALRNRLLADPRFVRWAARFPPTRWIARRRAAELFDLCAGFVYSQVLLACVRLRLLPQLAAGPASVDRIAGLVDLPPAAAARLLRAAAALGLAQRHRGERYGLGPLGAALLGNPGVTAMVEHHALLYADLADPVALLRGEGESGRMREYWPYAGAAAPEGLDAASVADYSALMSASQALVAEQVLDAYPLDEHRCLLDVGGGEGTFLAAAAARAPHLQLVLFDLPPVAARARERLEAAGLAGRLTVASGDFRRDDLPEGADLISLVRIVHDHDDEPARALLRSVRRALPPGGTLLLAEPMAGTPGAERVGDAYFGFYLLAMGSGRARRRGELVAMLHEAGFREIRAVPTPIPLQVQLLVARP